MAKIGYLRVSTTHQNTSRQEYAMPNDLDKTFVDKMSGKDTNRPEFQKMLDYVREGDIVYRACDRRRLGAFFIGSSTRPRAEMTS